MALVDVGAVYSAGMEDPELRREMRFFTGKVKIGVGGEFTTVAFEEGQLLGVEGDVPDGECKIVIDGTTDHWKHLLAPLPVPFYQCLQTTSVKHGLKLSTTNETFAYLPALNRLVVLLREDYNKEGTAP
jgi:hypothetical protein